MTGLNGGRARILLLLEHAENRRLLAECLHDRYDLINVPPGRELDAQFDLCLIDGRAMAHARKTVQARRTAEEPVLLPVLLVINREHATHMPSEIWGLVDDVAYTPVDKLELQARIEVLLRARRLSVALKLRSDDLEAFIYAMTHDLRAPLRSIAGFADLLEEEQAGRLDARGRHHVERIKEAAAEMARLISSLLEFSRLGRKALKLQTVAVQEMAENCVGSLQEEIADRGGVFEIGAAGALVLADGSLLKIAMNNLLSNAVKFTAPGVAPRVRVFAENREELVRVCVADNGIGVAEEARERIFSPFVRLHGVEDYAGAGLGLSTARKCAELMGGHIGVESAPGEGSIFWIELPAGKQQ